MSHTYTYVFTHKKGSKPTTGKSRDNRYADDRRKTKKGVSNGETDNGRKERKYKTIIFS